jgi:type VI secretion system protein ImpJ
MTALNKIVWAEGVFLAQQHLQQWDLYHETEQRLRSRNYAPLGWGISQLQIDKDALQNGLFRIIKCQIILPNGKLLDYDSSNADPLAYDLAKTPRVVHDIYLCLPANDNIGGITGYLTGGELCAWQAKFSELPDKFDADRVREVMLATPNLSILTELEPRDNYYSFKIAQLLCVGERNYEVDDKFIPTVLHLAASTVLQNSLRRIIELAETKIKILLERRRSFSGDISEFGQSDLAHLLSLEALNTELPALKHFLRQTLVHPENVYLALISLIGRLRTFNDSNEFESVSYQHENLTATFSVLEKELATLMSVVLPTRVEALKLNRENNALYAIDNIDSVMLTEQTFFLAVYLQADDTSWIDRFTQYVKVGSRQQIEIIVASALPGVHISHTQRPPSKLAIKTGYEYFRVDPRGSYWENVQQERSLAVFVAQEFTAAKIELVCVRE